jgi:PAT family beta-lactamase induction signal transducer AmpG
MNPQAEMYLVRLSQNFAVISEHRRWRFFVFFILYVAQGIPFGLILMALPPYLAAEGVGPLAISGFVTAALLPHAIKLINAPMMDRWTYWPMGKRRPWVLIAQLALILSLVALSLIPDPIANLTLLTIGCFVVNFCGAFQDVATDGMAVDLLPEEDQPRASGIMFGGVTLSGAGFAAATGWSLSEFGLAGTALFCAGAVVLLSLVPLISRERPAEKLLPWTAGEANRARALPPENFAEIAANVKRYFLLPSSLLLGLAITVYGISRGVHLSLMPVYFVQDLGWTDTAFSSISGLALLVGGAFAMLFGGTILNLFGRQRTFAIGCGLMSISAVLIAMLPALSDSEVVMSAYRVAYNTLDTLIVVAGISIGMAISAKVIAATQFAIYMALSNVGYSMGSALFGQLQLSLSYSQVFLVFAAIAASGILIIHLVAIDAHNKRTLSMEANTA